MKKLIYIVILLMLAGPTLTHAQTISWDDQYKYWYYRHRLHESFTIAGEAENMCEPSGLSLPAQGAICYGNDAQHYYLSWSDNPAQMLGFYIGVLATELKLLYLNNQPYDSTQQELYYAMKAYERLDYNCECLYYPKTDTTVGEINGLFCRDDVPAEMLWDYDDGGLYQNWRDSNHYATTVFAAYEDQRAIENNEKEYNEVTIHPSPEEWVGLMTGFALLVKSLADCPQEVVVYNNYRFIDEAILHTQRYMDRYQANGWVGKLTNGEVYNFGAEPMLVQGIFGLAKAADYICDPDRDYFVPLNINPTRDYAAQFPYHGPVQVLLEGLIFPLTYCAENVLNLLFGQSPPDILCDYQQYIWYLMGDPYSNFLTLENIGQFLYNYFVLHNCNWEWLCGENGIIEQGNVWVATTSYAYAAIGDSWKVVEAGIPISNTTYQSLRHYCTPMKWEYYPLLNLYLHEKTRSSSDDVRKAVISDLNNAPLRGPHDHPNLERDPSTAPPGWKTHFKWTEIYDRTYLGDPNRIGGVEGNGLDYMLAYNLLWLEVLQNAGTIGDYIFYDYVNHREKPYNVKGGSRGIVFYHYGELEMDEMSTYSIENYDHIYVAAQGDITIQGNMDIGSGKTLDVTSYGRLTLPIIDELTDQ